MPGWAASLIAQAGEALLLGIGAAIAAHQTGQDWNTSLSIGVAAVVGKIIPKQVIPTGGSNAGQSKAP